MHPLVVEITEAEQVVITPPGGAGPVCVSMEQIRFLGDLLQQARMKIMEDRQNRSGYSR